MAEIIKITSTKLCPKCGRDLPRTEYHKQKRGDKIYCKAWCKSCTAERTAIRYNNRSEARKKRDRAKRKYKIDEKRVWFDSLKNSLKCSRCSESRTPCLEFHHTDPDTKEYDISYIARKGSFSKEFVLREISKCIVLCSNCHRMEHFGDA